MTSPRTTEGPGLAAGPTLAEAAARIAAGSLSCEALMRDCIARAQAHPELNIFITLDADNALAAARRADTARAAGQPQGPLAGLPIVVKDNIHAAGLPATAGTPALADFVPAQDAPTVRKLREAGAVILGKTNMHELAFGATGYNHAFHHPDSVGVRNPYDPSRIAGGSSSGSAAALGARMAVAALGTDTGGSMRIPCALNGCASLRPSWGRYSGQGVIPIANSRDTVGPMALCMADVALLDALISGEQALHPVRLDSLRLGVVDSFWANLDDDTRALTDAAVKKLEAAGVRFIEVPDARLKELNEPIGFAVVFHEAYDDMVAYLREQGPGISIETLYEQIASPDVKGLYRDLVLARKTFGPGGTLVDVGPAYQEAVRHGRPALKARYRELFERYQLDAFVFPTTPVVAPLARPEVSLPENFQALIQNTEPAASACLASIQLPIGLGPRTGLPVGMELDGPAGGDRRLLSIGMALEAVLGRVASAF
ncbi:indoleacetamide hydrolase [Azoarcus olearius]|uniref:Indole acetamide hydrolase n=1 Tax=Azoarcus sp. (strain BH72) TaxID=418699 RepID=A1K6W7_AZOSB|nr:indoleacetamide hydrolase [Azoarcus olearius]CAL94572.1 indole acetamide hydrolase [Azoarcus olearius]